MLQIGKNITLANEIMQAVKIESIFRATLNDKGEIATLIRRLHSVRMLDKNTYRKLKVQLPYLVCAKFHPKSRKKENFLYTDSFFLDLDHLQAYDLNMQQVKAKIKKDPRVVFLFTSPGGDGLKVLFKLKERITDTSYYSVFYKTFAMKFAVQYELSGVVDLKTNDVSRCCFVSFDSEAYLNLDAERVDAKEYMMEQSDSVSFEIQLEIKQTEKEIKQSHKEKGIAGTKEPKALTEDVLMQIKKKVGVRVKEKKEKHYIQPNELETIVPKVIQELAEIDVKLVKMKPISYGRQIRVAAGIYWAEVNIFYGAKGVNVVQTTKSGSNRELCESVVLFLKDKFQNRIVS